MSSCATYFDILSRLDQNTCPHFSSQGLSSQQFPRRGDDSPNLKHFRSVSSAFCIFSLHFHYLEWPDGFRVVPSFWLPAGSHANTITKPGLPMHRCGILSLHHVQSRQLLRQWRDIKSTWGFTNNIGASLDCPVLGFAHAEEGKPSVTTPGACHIPKRG